MSQIFLSVLLLFALSSENTNAQESTGTIAEPNSSIIQAAPAEAIKAPDVAAPIIQTKEIEKIEVTGSHIKRMDVEGVSPVVTINRKDMEKTGYNSVSDVVRDLSVNSFGSARESSGSNAAGVAQD